VLARGPVAFTETLPCNSGSTLFVRELCSSEGTWKRKELHITRSQYVLYYMKRRDDELHQLASFMVLTGLDQLSRMAAIQHLVQQDRGILTTVAEGGEQILRWSNCRQYTSQEQLADKYDLGLV
jgi:hypothetical protein